MDDKYKRELIREGKRCLRNARKQRDPHWDSWYQWIRDHGHELLELLVEENVDPRLEQHAETIDELVDNADPVDLRGAIEDAFLAGYEIAEQKPAKPFVEARCTYLVDRGDTKSRCVLDANHAGGHQRESDQVRAVPFSRCTTLVNGSQCVLKAKHEGFHVRGDQ